MALLSLRNVSISYGGPAVLDEVSFSVEPGDRACVTGRNGEGKSTLLKIIAGTIQPDTGEIIRQPGLRTAFLTQDVPRDTDGTVTDIVARGLSHEARDTHHPGPALFLTQLGLDGEALFNTLSGGMRRRVLLARALVADPDLLLLDEPTNHLDIFAREALENALMEFGGTIIFVSHDRYFIDKLATHVWVLDGGSLHEFVGGFAAYEEIRKQASERKAEESAEDEVPRCRSVSKRSPNEERRLQQARAALEDEIVHLEDKMEELEEALATPELYQEGDSTLVTVLQEYEEIKDVLREKYAEWERLVDEH
jgi:ATP-binding cassette subfamily F protein uup